MNSIQLLHYNNVPYDKKTTENGKSIEYSEIEHVDFRNTGDNFYKINSGSTGEKFFLINKDLLPSNKVRLTKSYIPVVHNCVIQFSEDTTKTKT
mmetsp:Transcript_29238/g.33497  ORF Transcript_29238/g.33497 Transcript_29238/m.33497 type:complete len:94 (-) Transcript_29238:1470-1751(-)